MGRPPLLAALAMCAIAAPITLLGAVEPPHGGAAAGVAAAVPTAAPPRAAPRLTSQVGTGSLALPGMIVDGTGAAVEGVVVTARVEADAASAAVIATSGPDGRFTLEGLQPGRHRLEVEADAIFTAEVRFVPVPSDDIRIVVARRVVLEGGVVDGKQPIADARVEIAGDAIAGRRAATTTADGTFAFGDLPEGDYRVWAWRGELAARAQHVRRLGPGPFAPVVLELEPGAIVVGRVVDRDGGRGVAAAVELRSVDSDAEAARYVRADADGTFRVEGVPHGRWTADAFAPGWVTVATVEFQAGKGTPAIELEWGGAIEGRVVDDRGSPVAGATIGAVGERGTVVASERDAIDRLRRYSGLALAIAAATGPAATAPPAEDPRFVPRGELGVLLGPIPFPPPAGTATATVLRQAAIVDRLSPDPAPLPAEPGREAIWMTDRDGRFRITGLAEATVRIVASAPGYAEAASAPIAIAPAKTESNVVVTLTVGTMLVGKVTNQRGQGVAGAAVAITREGGPDARPIEAYADPSGAYRIGPLAGTVIASASAYGHAMVRETFAVPAPPPGATSPAEHRRDFVLAVADAELVGTVEDPTGLPVRGATVTIVGGAAAGRRAITTAAGFAIAMLPPGPLTVRIEHPGFPPQQVDTATGAGVRLVLPWGGGASGLVMDRHTGTPIGNVVVTASSPMGRAETSASATGAFELPSLAPGTWRLAITHPGYIAMVREIEIAPGDRANAITLRDLQIELERGALLAGTVRDRYGTRIAGARVSVSRVTNDGATVSATTDADGAFRLRDAPIGALVITVAKGSQSGKLTLTAAPGDERLTLELEMK